MNSNYLSLNDQRALFLAHLSHSFHSRAFSLFLAHLCHSFLLSTLKKFISQNICGMQNYIMLNKRYLLFYADIISRVETNITIFCLQFEGENKLN
jgi:hypothetical protein